MGDFGIAGLWVLLATALVVAILVGAGSMWLADRTLPKPPAQRWAQRGAVAVLDLCRTGLRGSARIHHRRGLGAVLLCRGQRLKRGVHSDNDVPADRRHARSRAGTDARTAPGLHDGWSRAPNGKTRYAPVVELRVHEMRSTRCTGCSVVSSPASGRTRSVRSSSTRWTRWRRSAVSESWTPNLEYPGCSWTGLLFGGVLLLTLGGFMRLGSTRAHLLLLSGVAVLLGLLLFIVFWLDHPFGNQLGVTSEPFEQSLVVFGTHRPWDMSCRSSEADSGRSDDGSASGLSRPDSGETTLMSLAAKAIDRFVNPPRSVDPGRLREVVSGATVLVTGSSFGIGEATACKLAAAGATVLLAASVGGQARRSCADDQRERRARGQLSGRPERRGHLRSPGEADHR